MNVVEYETRISTDLLYYAKLSDDSNDPLSTELLALFGDSVRDFSVCFKPNGRAGHPAWETMLSFATHYGLNNYLRQQLPQSSDITTELRGSLVRLALQS